MLTICLFATHPPGGAHGGRGGLAPARRIAYIARMTPTLYGIPNCDTVKKARVWLDQHGVAFEFHDYKKAGIDRPRLEAWTAEHGWETVLNRAGTTFKKLPEADKAGLDADKAIDLMLAQPSMIKRPVLDLGGRTLVGFKPDLYAATVV